MWTSAFWKGAAERALRMAAGTIVGIMTADGFNALNTNWVASAIAVSIAMIVSICLSLLAGGTDMGPVGSPSLVYDRPRDVGVQVKDGS